MGALDLFDKIATIIVVSSLAVGFWEIGSDLGSISTIVDKVLTDPIRFGGFLALYLVCVDTWTPTIPAEMLGQFSFLKYLWWFTDGYLPHYSLWSMLVGLVTATVVTWIVLHATDWDFWFHGVAIWIFSLLIGYYVWTVVAFFLMGYAGSMIGLSTEQVYEVWKASASATSPPLLQQFFLLSIPIGIIWLGRKII